LTPKAAHWAAFGVFTHSRDKGEGLWVTPEKRDFGDKNNFLAKLFANIKKILYLCGDFEKHPKYQRLRHYFCMQQPTAYQYFTTGLTSVNRVYAL
jgi:hypothetical protein